MRYFVLIPILILAFCLNSQAQDPDAVYRFDTLGNQKSVQIIALPVVFYTPETSVGLGGGAQLFFPRQSNIYNARLSNIFVSAIYTLNKQFVLDVKPQIYFGKGDYFLDMAFKYQVFPNSFWGVGNTTPESALEKFNMTSTELRVSMLRRLPPILNFGFEFIFEYHDVTETEEGGQLESGEIFGSDQATLSGLGAIFNLDSRDNIEGPNSGHFLQLNAGFSSELLGASSGYNRFVFDLRTYRPLGKNSVLALQVYSENQFGDIPFQGLATFGGGERARGYFRGRYIDNSQYVIQAEYRWRFKPRWVAAGFVLMGEVADLPRNYFSNIKPAIGGGIRFKITKKQNTHIRLDIGFGNEGSGVYFGINEAF